MTSPTATAARIRAERERLGLSQSEAARRAGMSRRAYRLLETTANPTLATLEALAAIGMDARAIAPGLKMTSRPKSP